MTDEFKLRHLRVIIRQNEVNLLKFSMEAEDLRESDMYAGSAACCRIILEEMDKLWPELATTVNVPDIKE